MQSASTSPRVLVADDQPYVIDAVRLLLKTEGWQIRAAGSPAELVAALESGEELDVVLMDLNYARDTTSGQEGLDLLKQIQQLDPLLPVVVMTAWSSVETAVEAMRRGARDYVQKPFDNARLLATLRTQVELGRALRKSRRPEEEKSRRDEDVPELIASGPAMQPVLQMIERIGPSDANVLITGEHGTGKEVVARRLHAVSPRASRALVSINAGSLSDGVFESEMFGHVKGDVRLVSATNAEVTAEMRDKRFREDLMYRLNTVEIRLPPLRERREDIPLLAEHFLERTVRKYRHPPTAFSPAALQAIVEYSWPGNVRELEHTVERGLLMARGERIELDDLRLRAGAPAADLEAMTLEEAERWFIERTLSRCEGNVGKAADALGLSRSALYRRLQKPD